MKNPDFKKLKKNIKKVNPILKEFRDFVNRGNVIDLAVGVIIGGAFNKIISSLVPQPFVNAQVHRRRLGSSLHW